MQPRLPGNTASTINPERLQSIALRRGKNEEITLVRNPCCPGLSAHGGRRRAPAGKSAHGIDHRAELPQGRLRHLHAVLLHRVEASPDETDPTETVPGRLCFVNLPRLKFEELRRVDGVVCFLRGANYGPLEFPDVTIEALYFAEHERRQAFLYEQHCRKENERPEQIQHLRGQLRKILPKGRKARVSMVNQTASAIDSLSPPIKERV
ncbi:hypothetical protein CN087_02710 [Sinorhizobium meliloti]|nr:hypothetical protein CN087_02710 [Sinorhizobium meliloti]